MITRKQQAVRSAVERFVDTYIATYFGNLSVDQFIYVDEAYKIVANRIASLIKLREIALRYVDEYSFVRSDLYEYLFNKSLLLADLNYKMIPEVFKDLNTIANNVIEGAESLSKFITITEDVVKALEGSLKEKVSISSVKNEIMIYDTIGTSSPMIEGTLALDKRAGCITLGVASSEMIPFTIKGTVVNKDKGQITKPNAGDLTWDFISNGYFTSRTFSESPLLENDTTENIGRMVDQDLETAYLVEYSTTDDRDSLKMGIELSFDQGRVDMLNIVVDPSDMMSVTTSSVILPELTRLLVHAGNDTEDSTSLALDNMIEIRGTTLGMMETAISHKRPDIYPMGSFFVGKNGITGLTVELTSRNPQEIFYPEKEVRDGSGNLLHRFNYFETLVLNKYQPPFEHVSPLEFYSKQEVTEMSEIMATGSVVQDVRNLLFRYFIGVKEIQLLRMSYYSKGYAISSNLNTSGKEIAGADLFVNEYVPDTTAIRYYLSPDKVEWYEITPASRVSTDGIARRIVFEGFDAIPGDLLIGAKTKELYLKVEMDGSGEVTPLLKAYAVRIKLQ